MAMSQGVPRDSPIVELDDAIVHGKSSNEHKRCLITREYWQRSLDDSATIELAAAYIFGHPSNGRCRAPMTWGAPRPVLSLRTVHLLKK